jgi:hypothetical protein
MASCCDPLYWLSEKRHWSGFPDFLAVFGDSKAVLFKTLMAIL